VGGEVLLCFGEVRWLGELRPSERYGSFGPQRPGERGVLEPRGEHLRVLAIGPTSSDREEVARLLGRVPSGRFSVRVRRGDGAIAVIVNAPFLDDGRPMPTRYWLVDPKVREALSRLEASGGVRRAEAETDPAELSAAHERYAAERDAEVPADHEGPRPTGGVGGTRRGVKCLHAHVAWFLAGGDDPVGRWAASQLGIDRGAYVLEQGDAP
jgi:hypothetical protein